MSKKKIPVESKPVAEASPAKVSYWIWLSSLVIFMVSTAMLGRASYSVEKFWIVVMLVDVIVGLVAFINAIRLLAGSKSSRYGLATFVTFFAFFGLLLSYSKIEAKLGLTPAPRIVQPTVKPQTTSYPTPTPKPTQAPPRQVTTKKSPTPTPQPEQTQANPTTVSCPLTFGTYYMTPEECNRYTSQGYGKGSTSTYTYPSYAPTSQTSPTSTPQSQNNEAELAGRQRQECLQNAQTTYNSQLRYCDTLSFYGDPRLKDGCVSQANQKYAGDKGSCN